MLLYFHAGHIQCLGNNFAFLLRFLFFIVAFVDSALCCDAIFTKYARWIVFVFRPNCDFGEFSFSVAFFPRYSRFIFLFLYAECFSFCLFLCVVICAVVSFIRHILTENAYCRDFFIFNRSRFLLILFSLYFSFSFLFRFSFRKFFFRSSVFSIFRFYLPFLCAHLDRSLA